MKRIRNVIAVTLMLGTQAALADWSFYAGLNQNNINQQDNRGQFIENIDDEADGYELGLTYRILGLVGVEAGYTSFGSFDGFRQCIAAPGRVCAAVVERTNTDVTAWNVGLNARIPVGSFSMNGSASYFIFDEDDTDTILDEEEWVLRAGVDYHFTDNLALGVGYKAGDIIESGYDARVTFSF